ncbi:hypothetical protein SCHPADRAFT_742859 [Schizopora paradoxa]|uniref:Uncharacterized protein n=1 Tax=Schizopora paradoxa TaxID=27342 RepID=A0A0H2R0X9_9AGAM|nr:hypothetical protein SCHPADRAFT_742859 [Schizopora paradoxa]
MPCESAMGEICWDDCRSSAHAARHQFRLFHHTSTLNSPSPLRRRRLRAISSAAFFKRTLITLELSISTFKRTERSNRTDALQLVTVVFLQISFSRLVKTTSGISRRPIR